MGNRLLLVPILISLGCFYDVLSLSGSHIRRKLHFFYVMKLEIPFQKYNPGNMLVRNCAGNVGTGSMLGMYPCCHLDRVHTCCSVG